MADFLLQKWYTWVFGYRELAQKIWRWYLENCRFFYNGQLLMVISLFLKQFKKEKKWPPKARQKKKIYNFSVVNSKFFVQVFYTQKPQYTNFAAKNQPFSNLFLSWNLDHSHWLNFFYKIEFLWNIIFLHFLLYLIN